MLKINEENKFEVKFKEVFERRVGDLAKGEQYEKLEGIAQNWIYGNRGDGLEAILANQKIQMIIDMTDFQLKEALKNI